MYLKILICPLFFYDDSCDWWGEEGNERCRACEVLWPYTQNPWYVQSILAEEGARWWERWWVYFLRSKSLDCLFTCHWMWLLLDNENTSLGAQGNESPQLPSTSMEAKMEMDQTWSSVIHGSWSTWALLGSQTLEEEDSGFTIMREWHPFVNCCVRANPDSWSHFTSSGSHCRLKPVLYTKSFPVMDWNVLLWIDSNYIHISFNKLFLVNEKQVHCWFLLWI